MTKLDITSFIIINKNYASINDQINQFIKQNTINYYSDI